MANAIMSLSNLLRVNDVGPVDGSSNAANVGRRASQPQAATAAEVDRTDLSGQGEVLRSATVTLRSLSTFRSDQVAALKAGIAAGSYQPDPTEVARAVGRALGGVTS